MSEFQRNALIGAFLVVGLGALTWLIIVFGEAPTWLIGGKTYPVPVYFTAVDTVRVNDHVHMQGVQIGLISEIHFRDPQHPEAGVEVIMDIQEKWRIPRSSRVRVELATIGFGRPLVKIILPTTPTTDYLPKDGSVPIPGEMVSAFDSLFPQDLANGLGTATQELGKLASALTPVAKDLDHLLEPRTIQEVDAPTPGLPRKSGNISTAVKRMDAALRHFNEVLGDPNNKSNIRIALENVREMSEQGKAVMADIKKVAEQARFVAEDAKQLTSKLNTFAGKADAKLDEVSRVIIDSTEKLGRFFDHLNKVGRTIADGKGTAGKFVNDPELYDSMVLTMKRLQLAIEDLNVLVKQWQREGLDVKGMGVFK